MTKAGQTAVAFLHPDLGIGGAERLVVDAGLALQKAGHHVHYYTSHHDKTHCFKETIDGTFGVTVYGDWLPRSICGYLHALCAYIRMVYLTVMVMVVSSGYDVYFCDQISHGIPVLRLCGAKCLFYCHFPDQLLAKKTSWLKQVYRTPLNWLEELTTGMAHVLMVNSNFTARIFGETFTGLTVVPDVLYPSLNFTAFDVEPDMATIDELVPKTAKVVFLSINRFERKKNLKLAVQALAELKARLPTGGEKGSVSWSDVHLVMAGGYDSQNTENIEHYKELTDIVDAEGLGDGITFLRSFSDAQKIALLKRCNCLLYTPSNEHFGIVPIESMYCRRPVIAVNSGGPLETVAGTEASAAGEKQTGFLCEPEPYAFAAAMATICGDLQAAKKYGEDGHERVCTLFSFQAFQDQLSDAVATLSGGGKKQN